MTPATKGYPLWLKGLLGLLPPLLLLLLWYLLTRGEEAVIPSLPTISETCTVLVNPSHKPENLDSPALTACIFISLTRVALGFLLALITAVPLGILIARNLHAHHLFTPLVELCRPISPVAWLPLAIILFGFDSLGTVFFGDDSWRHDLLDQLQLAIIAIIWWGAFFPILINTIHGVSTVKRFFIEVALANGATKKQVLRHVVIPAALPTIMVGIRLGMGRAMMIIVAAEFFPGTRSGLGHLIISSHQETEYQYSFACILILALLGLALNAFLQVVENRSSRWLIKER